MEDVFPASGFVSNTATLGELLADYVMRGLRVAGVRGTLVKMDLEQSRPSLNQVGYPPLRLTIEMDLVSGLRLVELRAAVIRAEGDPMEQPPLNRRIISLGEEEV